MSLNANFGLFLIGLGFDGVAYSASRTVSVPWLGIVLMMKSAYQHSFNPKRAAHKQKIEG